MPRYFFNCEGAQNFQDQEGSEFDTLAEVRLQAITNAAEVLRERPSEFSESPYWRVFVTDADGQVVFWLRLIGQELQEAM